MSEQRPEDLTPSGGEAGDDDAVGLDIPTVDVEPDVDKIEGEAPYEA